MVALTAALMASTASAQSLAERDKLTGDWNGARTALADHGIEVTFEYIGEIFGISGGVEPGGPHATYEGRFQLSLDADLEKMVGWHGAKAHITTFQIHDAQHKNAADYVGSLADPSNIDAYSTVRLFTLWLEQGFGDFASVRVGQLAADDEFLTSDTAGGLINGTFGWATIMSANLPSGGPAYPLATPGVRVQVNPTKNVSVLGAVFSGDPAGGDCYTTGAGDPQVCNNHGTTFSFDGGAFWIGELQYNANKEEGSTGLAASYKIGAWYHTADFSDLHYGVMGDGTIISIAGGPDADLLHQGNWGIYGVADQMVWRGPESSISVFVRGGWAPEDRNLVSWYIDGGVGFKGFVPGRADDVLTIGVAHANISDDAKSLDRDVPIYTGNYWPTRSGETVFEVSYSAQVTPWWKIQPDFQYIVKPGAGVLRDEDDASLGEVEDAYVFGVRTTVTF
ncbi:Carbohydrate-selective porin [Rhodovulum sp. PH10]|uniref:carbohydrate porin n=1 Tax=Rhodovulum sp. PH10 TaxID=1187851 RepID=UPI00027C1FA4|nr:carbohydrate porin [Rhodovulum sp. PH10]EJW13266.1 Carbohydrate-selective porin [Rhodovulum sp. PH10]